MLRPNDGPAHVELNVRDATHNQTWLFAEGWWASTFEPPTFGELWSWSFVSVPATAAMHANAMVDSAFRRLKSSRGPQAIYEGIRLGVMVLFLIALVMLSPLILALLTLLLIAGLVASALPIDALRTAVAKAQLISIGTIGDTKRLIDSPTQSGAIKSPVADGIKWLRERGCDKIVIISHSQGAAVTYKALVDMANGVHGPVADFRKIDSFISVGSGLPKVHALEYLSSKEGRWLRLASVAVPVSAVVGALSLRFLRREDALQGLIFPTLIFVATMLLVVAFTIEMARRKRQKHPKHNKLRDQPGLSINGLRLARFGFAVVGLIGTVIAALSVDQSLIVVLASIAIAIGMTGVYIISSSEIPRIPHTLASVVDRWVDLWASVDPVPAGATRTVVPGRPETWRVTNLGSVALDHNSYSDNDDECLTLIGTELLVQSGIGTSADLDEPRFRQNERRWRVGWRSFVSYMLTGAAAVFAWTTWRGADDALIRWYDQIMADEALLNTWYPGDLPGFIPDTMSAGAAEFVSILGYIVIGIAAIRIGNGAWSAWNNAEARYEMTRSAQMVDHRSEELQEDHDRSVPATFRLMIALVVFAWFIAIVPRWVWASWQALDLTSWRGLGVFSAAIGVSLAIGSLLPPLLDKLGIKDWVMTRDTSHIEGLIGYGKYQLHQGQSDDAIDSLRRAADLSMRSGHANANAMGTLAKALAWKAQELTSAARAGDEHTSIGLLETEALSLYEKARALPRQVTARNLIDYASQLDVMGGAHVTVVDLLTRARENHRSHPAVVIAAVAFDMQQRVGWTDHAEDLRARIPTWDPADQLAGHFTLLAANSIRTDGTELGHGTWQQWDLDHHFFAMLGTGATAPLADLRPLMRRVNESAMNAHAKSEFSQLAARITSTVPPVPTLDLTQDELASLADNSADNSADNDAHDEPANV